VAKSVCYVVAGKSLHNSREILLVGSTLLSTKICFCNNNNYNNNNRWDGIHPTTAAHKYFAKEMFESMEQQDRGQRGSGCMDTECYGDSIFDKCFNSGAASLGGVVAIFVSLVAIVVLH
jgi:hypothetical protein